MTPMPTGGRDTRVATFTWTPTTGELRSSEMLVSLLDLDTDDDRPLLKRIVDHLPAADVDRLRDAVRDVRSGVEPQPVEVELVVRNGSVRHLRTTATRAPGDRSDSVLGVVHDVTRCRHIERALEVRHAVTAALANWESLGFDGLLGPLGSALCATRVTVWAPLDSALRPVAAWRPDGDAVVDGTAPPSAIVTRARQLGLPVAGGAGAREELAFPVVTLSGVLAVIEFRSESGLWISDTLTRLLGSVGREIGAFFAARPCTAETVDLSPREREVLTLAAQGLSAPEIAAILVVSPATVRSHMRNVYAKLDVGDRVSAVVKAIRAGLVG